MAWPCRARPVAGRRHLLWRVTPQKLDTKKLAAFRRELAAAINLKDIAASFGISRSTQYTALAREDEQKADKANVPPQQGRGRPKRVAVAGEGFSL
jgi:transposase